MFRFDSNVEVPTYMKNTSMTFVNISNFTSTKTYYTNKLHYVSFAINPSTFTTPRKKSLGKTEKLPNDTNDPYRCQVLMKDLHSIYIAKWLTYCHARVYISMTNKTGIMTSVCNNVPNTHYQKKVIL